MENEKLKTGCPACVHLDPMPRYQNTPACRLGGCKFEPMEVKSELLQKA